MTETRVVDEARVRAAVKRVHMARLNRRLSPKNAARMRYSTILLSGERERACAIAWDHDVVRAVVVLSKMSSGLVLASASRSDGKRNSLQLRKHAVECGTAAARDSKQKPYRLLS